MINFLKKLLRRDVGHGWVRVRAGEPISFKPGQKYDTLHYGGAVVTGWTWGLDEIRIGSDGDRYRQYPPVKGPTPVWAGGNVKAYRLAEPQMPAEAVETRARRENQWRDWAKDPQAPVTAPEGPLRRKRVQSWTQAPSAPPPAGGLDCLRGLLWQPMRKIRFR